ncbi:MAG: hypothetical protein V4504_01615 [Patescibacteria group bacterium]
MIYLFSGDDTKKKRIAYEKFAASFPKDVEKFFIIKNDFDMLQLETFYSSQGLFFTKCVVFLENTFEREEIQDFILDKLPIIAESSNDFVFLEGKLNKPILDAFKKARAEINVYELPKEAKEKYNNFILANDFGAKDKLGLWLHYRQAVDLGVGLEELVGVLFWKAKDMLVKKNFGKFSEAELKNFTSKISYLLPKARGEGLDDEIAFEQFLLEVF